LSTRAWLVAGWVVTLGLALGVRLWNALAGPLMWGYDAWGHVAYVLFLDLYRAVPWADQGWSYFHPPLHYALGWLLAQAGSGEVLMRGLSFAAVAFLPVHYFMSPMPGNELTASFLTAATLAAFIANEGRPAPSLLGALGVGALAGLALLAKFSGLLVLGVVSGALVLRALLRGGWGDAAPRVAARLVLTVLVAVAVSAPYYARNIRSFGTPFQLSRDFALVAPVERDQPPGVRTWKDYLRFPLAAFRDTNPLAPHLLHSVWASVYLNVWADTYRESDVARELEAERQQRRSSQLMALLGLLPTALFLIGAGLAWRDVWGGRRRAVYVPLLIQSALSLAAFAVFTWRVPLWSALKASYLLGLSLPYALFVARSLEAQLGGRLGRWRWALPAGLGAVALAASAVASAGLVLPRRADAPATGAVRFYFGEYDEARAVYGRLIAGAAYPVAWLDNLAAVELAEGRTEPARRLYARAVALEKGSGRGDPYRLGRLAVATVLDGAPREALALLDEAIEVAPLPELIANRGAVRVSLGDLAGAEGDLRAAVAQAPGQTPAWRNLAVVLDRLGRPAAAAEARAGAARAACRPPRGYPYGVGTGEVLEWGVARRGLLVLGDRGLSLAPPAAFRRTCG
jgi:tetratricopeptide (TPR) repeat protein